VNRLRIASYTMKDYGDPDNREPELWALGETVLADTDADFIAVCDVVGSQVVPTFEFLVQQVGWLMSGRNGMSCLVPGSGGELLPAFQEGWRGRGVGLMWRKDRVRPVPGSLRRHNEDPLCRGMVLADFIVDGVQVAVASTHLAPRPSEAERKDHLLVASEVVNSSRHAVACAHWNMELEWRRDHSRRTCGDKGLAGAVAQRDAVEELGDWGLFDPVAHIDAEVYGTVGHWSGDAVGRVGGPLVSRSVADATTAVAAVNNAMTRKASRHLPVVLDVAMDTLKAQVARRPSRLDGDGHRAIRAGLGKAG
jgi:endonuclease/exonuclease/phosphatase family metal-dependent hydrolase